MTRIDELTGMGWTKNHDRHDRTCELREGFSVRRWCDIPFDAIEREWQQLAKDAATPNPFLEPWFLRPSLAQFDPNAKVHIAVMVREGRLVGLMPICLQSSSSRLPFPVMANWLHANLFCGAPLVLPGLAQEFWGALFDWVDEHSRWALLLHLTHLPSNGEVFDALVAACGDQHRACRIVHREKRALLRRGLSPQEHLRQAVAKKQRKELHRKRRRLEDEGKLTVSRLSDAAGIEQWVDEFLILESAGWKGHDGSALACDPRTKTLFREALHGAAKAGRLERLAFHLDAKPVAMLCTFLSPPGSFGFKTSFDENLGRLSPGVLLQVENLGLLEDEKILWSDSCAAADHPMIDKIWRDRREMVRLSIAIGGPARRLLGGAIAKIEAARMEARQ